MKVLTREQAVAIIRKAIGGEVQHVFAKRHAIPQSIISTSLTGQREPSPKLLDAVGLEKVTAYRRKP